MEDQVPGSYEDIGKIDPGTAVTIYERLRYDERINAEPLFWLQYAIAMAEDRKLPAAQEFIATAYARAADRPGFQTYQIDTQALRILLLMESEAGSGSPVARLPEILEKIELLNSMLSEESHRGYAIRILEGIYPFIVHRVADLTLAEKTALTFWLTTLSQPLGQLPVEYRARSASDQTQATIERARRLLL